MDIYFLLELVKFLNYNYSSLLTVRLTTAKIIMKKNWLLAIPIFCCCYKGRKGSALCYSINFNKAIQQCRCHNHRRLAVARHLRRRSVCFRLAANVLRAFSYAPHTSLSQRPQSPPAAAQLARPWRCCQVFLSFRRCLKTTLNIVFDTLIGYWVYYYINVRFTFTNKAIASNVLCNSVTMRV